MGPLLSAQPLCAPVYGDTCNTSCTWELEVHDTCSPCISALNPSYIWKPSSLCPNVAHASHLGNYRSCLMGGFFLFHTQCKLLRILNQRSPRETCDGDRPMDHGCLRLSLGWHQFNVLILYVDKLQQFRLHGHLLGIIAVLHPNQPRYHAILVIPWITYMEAQPSSACQKSVGLSISPKCGLLWTVAWNCSQNNPQVRIMPSKIWISIHGRLTQPIIVLYTLGIKATPRNTKQKSSKAYKLLPFFILMLNLLY